MKLSHVKTTILPFAPNRVLRLYLGGSGIDRLCGIEPAEDTRYPENWIASCIEGNGRAYHSPGHGISRIRQNIFITPKRKLHTHIKQFIHYSLLPQPLATPLTTFCLCCC